MVHKIKLGKKVQKCIRRNSVNLGSGKIFRGYTAFRLHPDGSMIRWNTGSLKDARRFVKGGRC